MNIKTIINYENSENTYIVWADGETKCIVIDPGYKDAQAIIDAAAEEGLAIDYIFLTHCHYDHILSLEPLREKTRAALVTSRWCSVNIGDPYINLTSYAVEAPISAKKADVIMSDEEEMRFCGLRIRCICTPGHTNCGTCWLADNENLFSGDTLFLRSVGRWDLPTGNHSMLVRSVKERLYVLPENITVYPGHGDPTTIGYEKRYNMSVDASN